MTAAVPPRSVVATSAGSTSAATAAVGVAGGKTAANGPPLHVRARPRTAPVTVRRPSGAAARATSSAPSCLSMARRGRQRTTTRTAVVDAGGGADAAAVGDGRGASMARPVDNGAHTGAHPRVSEWGEGDTGAESSSTHVHECAFLKSHPVEGGVSEPLSSQEATKGQAVHHEGARWWARWHWWQVVLLNF